MNTVKRFMVVACIFSAGCTSIRTKPGDTYTESVKTNGYATWSRLVGDEMRCEYFYDGGRWLVVAFDSSDFIGWKAGYELAKTHPEKVELVEPKVKWAQYDIGAAYRSWR